MLTSFTNRLMANGSLHTCSRNTITDVATPRVALRWICDSPRTGCERTIPIYKWRKQAIIKWSRRVCCCLLPQCEALRTCCSDFPIATLTIIGSPAYFNLFKGGATRTRPISVLNRQYQRLQTTRIRRCQNRKVFPRAHWMQWCEIRTPP